MIDLEGRNRQKPSSSFYCVVKSKLHLFCFCFEIKSAIFKISAVDIIEKSIVHDSNKKLLR
jgi:hypothetical protein